MAPHRETTQRLDKSEPIPFEGRPGRHPYDPASVGAIAHLYRGEVYRSTTWRTRLDNTTNWAVVTTGIALSATFSGSDASVLPMVLVGLLVIVFLIFEARRYRYFNVWRVRARLLETDFFVPLLRGDSGTGGTRWSERLAHEYLSPHYHISFASAVGRRLRRNYSWILLIQVCAYYGKLAIHPVPLTSLQDMYARAAIGPVPGELMVAAGLLFHGGWMAFAYLTWLYDRRSHDDEETRSVD